MPAKKRPAPVASTRPFRLPNPPYGSARWREAEARVTEDVRERAGQPDPGVRVRRIAAERYRLSTNDAEAATSLRYLLPSQNEMAALVAREPGVLTPLLNAYLGVGGMRGTVARTVLRDLKRWVAAQTEPGELLDLLKMPGQTVRLILAAEARAWSPALVDGLVSLTRHDDGEDVLRALAGNPTLTGETATYAANRLWSRFQPWPAPSAWLNLGDVRALRTLADRGVRLDGPISPTLVQHARVDGTLRTNRDDLRRLRVLCAHLSAVDQGVNAPTPKVWGDLRRHVGSDPVAASILIGHPSCTVARAAELLRLHSWSAPVRLAIASTPALVADRALRRQLLSTGADGALLAFLKPVAEPGELEEFVARAAANPVGLARGLSAARGAGPAIDVAPETAVRLLEGAPELREEAMLTLSDLSVDESHPRPAPKTRRRR